MNEKSWDDEFKERMLSFLDSLTEDQLENLSHIFVSIGSSFMVAYLKKVKKKGV